MIEVKTLRTIPLFMDLRDEELAELARLCQMKTLEKDKIIFMEEDAGEYFYVVLKGKVKIAIEGEGGKEVILSWLCEGDYFGEMALLDDEPRSATAVAAESTDLLLLKRQEFLRILKAHPSFMLRVFTILSRRVRRANHQIASLALLDVYGRVARVLMDLAMEEGKRLKDGRIQLKLPARREIANMIGTSRETVTRVLAGLAKQGYLENLGRVVILNESFPKTGKAA